MNSALGNPLLSRAALVRRPRLKCVSGLAACLALFFPAALAQVNAPGASNTNGAAGGGPAGDQAQTNIEA